MSKDKAEEVLRNALVRYAADNPEQKEELLNSLDTLLNKTATVAMMALECEKALLECLAMMNALQMSTSQISEAAQASG
jgi:hypothetical protein